MSTHLDALHVRKTFGRDDWSPPEPFGDDGFRMVARDRTASVIFTCAEHDGAEWVHASIARTDRMPDYADLVLLHHAVWRGHGYAYQVFVPPSEHVNIHEQALHLWGRLDGRDVLPSFAGTFALPGGSTLRSI